LDVDRSNWAGPKGASPETEAAIDEEVKALVAKAYAHAKKTLADNRDLVEDLTEALIEKETVDYRQLAEMIVKYHPEKKEALQKAAGSTSLGF